MPARQDRDLPGSCDLRIGIVEGDDRRVAFKPDLVRDQQRRFRRDRLAIRRQPSAARPESGGQLQSFTGVAVSELAVISGSAMTGPGASGRKPRGKARIGHRDRLGGADLLAVEGVAITATG